MEVWEGEGRRRGWREREREGGRGGGEGEEGGERGRERESSEDDYAKEQTRCMSEPLAQKHTEPWQVAL